MANKRKRDEVDDDSEEIAPGRQILPIADLPDNFDQDPEDGLQYLFLVRRDARRLPHVTRVHNPYEFPEASVAKEVPLRPPVSILPCEEWRAVFQSRFCNLRKNLSQPTIHVHFSLPGSNHRILPEKKDRDAWWKFLTGQPESEWGPKDRSSRKKSSSLHRMRAFPDASDIEPRKNDTASPDMQSTQDRLHSEPQSGSALDATLNPPRMSATQDSVSQCALGTCVSMVSCEANTLTSPEDGQKYLTQMTPREVTPNYLREIDHRMAIHLLMYFTHWINVHLQNPSDTSTLISNSHAQWIFALLIKVEDQLSADDMNLLRNLARACLRLVKDKQDKTEEITLTAGSRNDSDVEENQTSITDVSCWMLFTAIAGHWGQKDLWTDAEDTLANP
ncbi:hypothetical protein HYDPIDRAFT_164269 [Hydnomerulius pinastri MD-312]|nr:hypothetical protein HYDPIDRAFT_164269 [Hydnomerulius pinastri MD-312]